MPVWLPILKASLPYLTQIVTTAIPVFTSRSAGKASGKPLPDEVVGRQIAELQEAVTQNAESVHTLASKLQDTLQGIDFAANGLQSQLASLRRLARTALVVAVASLCVAAWALTRA
ncbi:MAG TPA: hypothetical protein VGC69_14415 [Bordetella sp.]